MPLQEFLVEHLRYTQFHSASANPNLMVELCGETANTTHRPNSHVIQDERSFKDHKLIIVQAPSKLDIILARLKSDSELFYEPAKACLLNYLKAWASKSGNVERIAIGGSAIRRASDRTAAYCLLKEAVPFLQLDGIEDVSFQGNKKTISKTIPDLRVNRLCVWCARQTINLMVELPTTKGASKTTNDKVIDNHLSITFDVNSDKDYQNEIKPDKIMSLSEEFFILTDAILVGGFPK